MLLKNGCSTLRPSCPLFSPQVFSFGWCMETVFQRAHRRPLALKKILADVDCWSTAHCSFRSCFGGYNRVRRFGWWWFFLQLNSRYFSRNRPCAVHCSKSTSICGQIPTTYFTTWRVSVSRQQVTRYSIVFEKVALTTNVETPRTRYPQLLVAPSAGVVDIQATSCRTFNYRLPAILIFHLSGTRNVASPPRGWYAL